MTFSDESYNLRIELDTKGCELSADEIARMEEDLGTLHKLVEQFPVSNLYITVIHHPRSNDYHVKTSLALPGRKLFTGDRDTVVHAAYERCLRKLTKKVKAYKQAGGRYAYAKLPKKTGLFEPKPTKIKVGGKRKSGKLMLLFDQSGKIVVTAKIEYGACSVDFLVRK